MNKSLRKTLIGVSCIIILLSINKVLCDSSSSYEDEDDEEPHQLVIFLISSLRGQDSTNEWMPFLGEISKYGVYTSNARTVGESRYGASVPAWTAALYGASSSEYGCVDDRATCKIPKERSGYQGMLDMLKYEEGYSVEIYSEHEECNDYRKCKDTLATAIRGKHPIINYDDRKTDMMNHGLLDKDLPQNNRRVLVFHFSGLKRIAESHGYESSAYKGQVLCIDWQISKLCKSLWKWEPKRTTFALTSDHGGSRYKHTDFSLLTLQVPFAMWGYGVKKNPDPNIYRDGVNIAQIPRTLFNVLSYDHPSYWIHDELQNCKEDDPENGVSYYDVAKTYDTDKYKPSICPLPSTIKHNKMKYFNGCVIILGVIIILFAACTTFPGPYFYRSG